MHKQVGFLVASATGHLVLDPFPVPGYPGTRERRHVYPGNTGTKLGLHGTCRMRLHTECITVYALGQRSDSSNVAGTASSRVPGYPVQL